jgi:hypothetical protein
MFFGGELFLMQTETARKTERIDEEKDRSPFQDGKDNQIEYFIHI